ncbi:hypothetical protein V8G54_021467, partial [Vigna mungo]
GDDRGRGKGRRESRAPVTSAGFVPGSEGRRRRRLGSSGDGSGSKLHHRRDLGSRSERRRLAARNAWMNCRRRVHIPLARRRRGKVVVVRRNDWRQLWQRLEAPVTLWTAPRDGRRQ